MIISVSNREADARYVVIAMLKSPLLAQDLEALTATYLRMPFSVRAQETKILPKVLFGVITRDTLQVKLAMLRACASQDSQEKDAKIELERTSSDVLHKMHLARQDKHVAIDLR